MSCIQLASQHIFLTILVHSLKQSLSQLELHFRLKGSPEIVWWEGLILGWENWGARKDRFPLSSDQTLNSSDSGQGFSHFTKSLKNVRSKLSHCQKDPVCDLPHKRINLVFENYHFISSPVPSMAKHTQENCYQRTFRGLVVYLHKLSVLFSISWKWETSEKCRFSFPISNSLNHHFEIKLHNLCLKHKVQTLSSNTPPTL